MRWRDTARGQLHIWKRHCSSCHPNWRHRKSFSRRDCSSFYQVLFAALLGTEQYIQHFLECLVGFLWFRWPCNDVGGSFGSRSIWTPTPNLQFHYGPQHYYSKSELRVWTGVHTDSNPSAQKRGGAERKGRSRKWEMAHVLGMRISFKGCCA